MRVFAAKIFPFITFSSIPLQFLFPFLAKYIIYIFFGEQYADSIPILRIMIFCQMPFAIYFFCSRFFLALHREKLTVAIDIMSLTFHFAGLIFLTRWLSAKGAALAVVATNIFLVAVYLFFLTKQKVTFPFVKSLAKNLLLLAVTGTYFLATFHKTFQPLRDLGHITVILLIAGTAFFLISELSFLRQKKSDAKSLTG